MSNKVFYDDDARRRLLAGAEILYRAVKTTMGPKGRNVVIARQFGAPTVTHDGVTVAKNIDIKETDETIGYKAGAELIKHAAGKMNDIAGDGTTTVTVLTYHILSEANKLIAAGHNPMLIRKGLEMAAKEVLKDLAGFSETIEGNKQRISEVATISAGDREIGNLIAEVMDKIGKEGVVSVEPGSGLELESEVVEGFTFDRGYMSPYMVTNVNRMEAVMKKPVVILVDYAITAVSDLFPILERLAQAGRKDILIVAEDIGGEALGMLVVNKLKGQLNAVAVKAPAFGDRRKAILKDMAVLTGGTVFSIDEGNRLNDEASAESCGTCRQVIVTKDSCTIIEGAGKWLDVQTRLNELTEQIEAATSEYEKEHLEKRRAALQNKVAVIRVGGVSETEIEEKKYRVDDAVAAVKAALAEGIVPGGGVTLVNLKGNMALSDPDDSINAGIKVLQNALEQPFRILMENSGIGADRWLTEMQVISERRGFGIDITNPTTLVDMKEAGVVDPTRVTKEAIQNAVSIAGTALTMGALAADEPVDPTQMQGPQIMPGRMPGMM